MNFFTTLSERCKDWFTVTSVPSDPVDTHSINLQSLEDRVLYSAVPLPVDFADAPVENVDLETLEFESIDATFDFFTAAIDESMALGEELAVDLPVVMDGGLDGGSDALTTETNELVIVDTSVDDYQQLVDGILKNSDGRNFTVEYINSNENGVQSITRGLEQHSSGNRFDALHIVSHGADGELQLGTTTLSLDNLGDNSEEISSWSEHFSDSADILIYGCDVAQSETGEAFVDEFARLTGTDIAASDDLTGDTALGGNWEFEYFVGAVDSELVFTVDAVADWQHTLAIEGTSEDGNNANRNLAADANGNLVFATTANNTVLSVDGDDVVVSGVTNDLSTALFSTFVVNETTAGDQKWATVASMENGDFLVVWTSDNGSDSGVFGRMFQADGTDKGIAEGFAYDGEFQIDAVGSFGNDAVVAMDKFGNFVVSWEVDDTDGGSDIFAQKYDTAGAKVGSVITVASGSVDQENPDIAINDVGEFVIGWETNGLNIQKFGFDGSSSNVVSYSSNISSQIAVDINNSGWVVATSTANIFNDGVWSNIYNPDLENIDTHLVHPADSGDQFNSSVAILDNNTVVYAWEGEGAISTDEQGTYFSVFAHDDGGTPGDSSDDSFTVAINETELEEDADKAANFDQRNAVVAKVRGESVAMGFTTDPLSYGVKSFATTLNQTPDVNDANVHRLENRDLTFSAANFDYTDNENDTFSKVAIRTLPTGSLFFQGNLITQADIDASTDGFVIDIADIGDLNYVQTTSMQDQFGVDQDSFEFRVHDGANFSTDNAEMSIDVDAEDRLWISTLADGNASGGLPDFEDGGSLQLGGPDLTFGDTSNGYWSSQFSLESLGYDIKGLHYVNEDITIGSMSLNKGDILFSVSDPGSIPSGNVELALAAANLNAPISFGDEDVIRFRPTSTDYSQGEFEIVLDMSHVADSGDSDSNFGEMRAFTLVESDTIIGDTTVAAGSFLFARSGGAEDNDIYLLTVDEVGELTTVADASVLIEGDDIGVDEKIVGLELIESTTTAGGQTLSSGTLLLTQDANGSVGTNGINVTPYDVFALDVEKTSLSGTAVANASIFLNGTDVDLESSTDSRIDALALLGSPDPSPPPSASSGFNTTVNEDSSYQFTGTEFGFSPSSNGLPLDQVIFEQPTNGKLIFQGQEILSGQAIDIVSIDDLIFVPDTHESDPSNYATISFMVSDGEATSATHTMQINVSAIAGDVIVNGGEQFIPIDSWSQVNDTSFGEQTNQKVAALNDGGYVVVWEQEVAGDKSVFYQAFDSNGEKTGSETEIDLPLGGGNNQTPSVTALADGGYLVVFTSDAFGGQEDIYAQRFDSSGNKVSVTGGTIVGGGAFKINEHGDNRQFDPNVTALSDGGFVVTWSSSDTDIAITGFDIVARSYEANGFAHDEHLVNTTNAGTQREPVAIGTETGGYAIAWTDSESEDVRVRVFDELGNSIGNEESTSFATQVTGRGPAIGLLDGNIVVAWQVDTTGSGDWEIYAQEVSGTDGQLIGTPTLVNSGQTVGNQVDPSIVTLPDGNILIGWSAPGENTGEAREIVARRFGSGLTQIGNEFEINSRVYGNQHTVEMAVLANGDLIATYTSADGDNLNSQWGEGVYADRLTPGAVGVEGTAIPLNVQVELLDTDGSESITQVELFNVPTGAVVSDGNGFTATSNGGPILITGATYSDLTVTPPANSFDDFVVEVVVSTEDNGSTARVSQAIAIDVQFDNTAPVLTGQTITTTEDQTSLISESQLFNEQMDIDTNSIGSPAISPNIIMDLDPANPPTVNAGTLTWTGNVISPSSTIDLTFDASHVTFDNNPVSDYPDIDSALVFDGAGGGEYAGFTGGSGTTTFELWFKPDSLTQDSALLEFGSANNGFGLYLHDDTVQFHVHSPTTVNGVETEPFVLTGSGITDTEFNHVMAVIETDGSLTGDADHPSLVLYVNGVRTDMILDINSLAPNFDWADSSSANVGTTDGDFAHATATTIDSFSGSIAKLNVYDGTVADEDQANRHRLQVAHSLGIHTIDGQTVNPGDTITLSGSGALVTLNLDGSLSYDPNGQFDGLAPGQANGTDTIDYEVSDGQGGFATSSVTVNIIPQNDAPVLTNGASVSVNEFAAVGTNVYDVQATDADHSEADGDFTYQIVNGNTGGAFEIDSATGVVSVVNPIGLDFETNPTFNLEVSVNDGNGGFDTTTITINVVDQAEVSIRGTIFDDEGADGSVVGDLGAAGGVIHLYQDIGTGTTNAAYIATVNTNADGNYEFSDLSQNLTYFVMVDAQSVISSDDYNHSTSVWNPWAEQTYVAGNALVRDGGVESFQNITGAFFGGATGGVSDAQTSSLLTGQHVTSITLGNTDHDNADFGFSFNVVTNVNDDTQLAPSQGSLRQFILNANAVRGENHMRFVPTVDANATGTSGDWWQQQVTEALPEITDSGTVIDGQAYAVTGGERDENTNFIGDTLNGGQLTADGTVGTGADGVMGTGDEAVALTANPNGPSTIAGLDAPELEIVNNDPTNKYGIVIRATEDGPSISNIEITNIAIHGFGDENDTHGANIYVNGSGESADGLTDFQVTDVSIHGNYIGFGVDSFINPDPTRHAAANNIAVKDADQGFIFNNVIAFASRSGIDFVGSSGDGSDDWTVSGNYIHGNAWSEPIFDGIDVGRDVDRLTVDSNLFTDNHGLGIDSWNSGDGHIYTNNTLTGNGIGGVETGGIRIFGENYIVKHNVIHNNTGPGVHVVGSNSQARIDHDAGTKALISQNSFSGNSSVAIDLSESLAQGLFFSDLDADGSTFLEVGEIPSSVLSDLASHDDDGDGKLSKEEYGAVGELILDQGDGVTENNDIYESYNGNEGIDHIKLTKVGLATDGSLRFTGKFSTNFSLSQVEVYVAAGTANDTVGGTVYGEGSTYIGTMNIGDFTVNSSGVFTGTLAEPALGWPPNITNLESVTTLAIDVDNNTSEFSNNIEVNQIPVAATEPAVDVPEENEYTLLEEDFGFSDSTGETISRIRIVSFPTNGTLLFDNVEINTPQNVTMDDIQLGRLTYISDVDFNGPDSISYRVFDGTHTSLNSAQVEFNVTAVNDAPTGADVSRTLTEDTPYSFDATDFGFSDSIANEGNQFHSILLTSAPGSGILTDGTTTFVGGDTILLSDLPNLEYVPTPNSNGTDEFRFQVIDNGGTDDGGINTDQTPRVFTLNVTPENDDPVISSGDTNSPENETSVMILTGTDPEMDSLTFSVVGGADGARFEVDPATDELRFIVAPDFSPREDANGDNVFEVEIQVEDGNGGSSTKLINVQITDVADEIPVFGPAENFDVLENLSTQFVIDEATDDDGDAITYSMASTGDHALFNFNPSTRAISFLSAPDFENPLDIGGDNTYELQIIATDATGLLSVPQTVTIVVKPLNDNAPDFTASTFSFDIVENDSTKTFDLSATDADLPVDTVTYELSGDDAALFQIDNNGNLEFISSPDFESPLDTDGDNIYSLTVTSNDNNGLTTDQIVTVTVTPENDNDPVFNGSNFEFDADENTNPVFDVSATDADTDETITYQLTGDDASHFSVDSSGILTFNAPFDFESPQSLDGDNIYELNVLANDGNGGETTQEVIVMIHEVNDNDPQFTEPSYRFTTPENQNPAFDISATDADDSDLTYRITNFRDGALFDIDANGVVTFKNSPDFETPLDFNANNNYDLMVRAKDGRGGTSLQLVSIDVTPVNDNAPAFQSSDPIFNVDENFNSTFDLSATDADAPTQTVTYTLAGDDAGEFVIDTNGQLAFTSSPDFELPTDSNNDNQYTVDVTADDGNGLTTTETVTVVINETNDNDPVFASGPQSFTMPENSSNLFAMPATDLDTPDTVLTYTLSGADASLFQVDANGTVSFIDAPDFENPLDSGADNIYSVTVTADDDRGRTGSEELKIEVTPRNDNAPVYAGNDFSFNVDENANPTFDLSASDADAPVETITYTLAGADATQFTISSTGQLSFVTPPDFEALGDADQDGTYQLEVIADDGNGQTTTQSVDITINPVNDNAPTISTTRFSQNEESLVAHQIIASDLDLPGDTLTFELTASGTDNGLFQIDPVTGELSFVAAPDFESPADSDGDNIYEVEVLVNDNAGQTTTTVVLVEVTPVNEFTPTITSPDSVNTAEGSTQVITVIAADGDRPHEILEFSISGGPDGGEFMIDPSTGELTFSAPTNYDNPTDVDGNNVYQVEVTVSDPDNNSTTQLITVKVIPTVNQAPEFTSDDYWQHENEQQTFNVNATDREGDDFSYSLSGSDNDNGYFELDPATGELHFKAEPDYENPLDTDGDNTYEVEVSVTDSNGLANIRVFEVEVRDRNEAASLSDDNVEGVVSNGQISTSESVFSNDSIPADSVVTVTQPTSHGSITLNGDGTFVFTPNGNFTGQDSFEYTINSGGEITTARVSIEAIQPTSVVNNNNDNTPEPEPESSEESTTPITDEPELGSSTGQSQSETAQTEPSTIAPPSNNSGADTISNDFEDLELAEEKLDFDTNLFGSTYVYAGAVNAELITNFHTGYVAKVVSGISTIEDTFLSVGFWQDMDSAKQEYLADLKIGIPMMAAASASLFTFTSIAMMARSLSGVLLTTFMTSQTWSSLDLLSVLDETAEDNESIEQIVDG